MNHRLATLTPEPNRRTQARTLMRIGAVFDGVLFAESEGEDVGCGSELKAGGQMDDLGWQFPKVCTPAKLMGDLADAT